MSTDRPGSLLCRPAFVASLAVLVVNDHYLKTAHPSWVTGKLSDLAGLALAPIALVSAIEVVGSILGHQPTNRLRAMTTWSLIVGGLFAMIQTVPAATNLYATAAGATSRVAMGAIGRGAASGPAAVTADLTDLLTLPALAVPVLVALRSAPAWQPLVPTGNDPALLR